MAGYVDGFVMPVKKSKLAAYKRLARLGAKVYLEHGALEYHECVADDVAWGKRTSFPRSIKQRRGEIVVFAYVVYRSRADRVRINKLVMADPRFAPYMDLKKLPFDAKRMFWGGFKTLVEAKARKRR